MDTSKFVLIAIAWITVVNGDCLFHDQCGWQQSAVGNVPVPCIYTGPPQVMNTTGFHESLDGFNITDFKKEFHDLCPDVDLTRPVCCSRSQAAGMISQMETPRSFLGRCPSCFRDFMQLVCTMICSPNQVSGVISASSIKS